ncbi:subtilisin-chymotrypsin inhibitor WSCI-like protein [Dunaliella salina]|uniref:Subtilisin-chymotrypsin inhibitor WSCI-like protein n=1 Tax=Dunaliella salina TaxID=3046 RepID=A0ABQ7FVE9_DUNSA|nr:subtilisin-chymotrypsin inhibitor WSCI-like protein [Dunaliella salina]|eukprot:KAF5826367.1 subtilisin-chymotrypsin inhibitor WSCI-like protein [Dunaliella salina]
MRIQALFLLFLSACAFLAVPEAVELGGEDLTMTVGAKRTWPELVGKPYAEAEAAIKRDAPDLTVSKVNSGSIVTMDFREDRVRVFVDKEGKVEKTPRPG